ncbi:SNF2 family N-terminal domain-containing protein [Apiospora arundinis]|uniref:SNF2 family N-terminal domain-containing protein n=1 Tax=Apiospora arundinis TaxID=335852 RepID=A0ABR2IRC1_9PEZI
MIRRRETTLYQGASQLTALFRWCLTGTPIQNHLEDIGSLLAFLRISQLEHKAVFRHHIIIPFAHDVEAASRNFAQLLDYICLRRSQELLHLPRVDESYRYLDFSEDERAQYDETLVRMARLVKEKVSKGPEGRNPFGIFQAQLQLRLVCNHGTFQKPFQPQTRRDRQHEKEDLLYSLGPNAERSCSACGIPVSVFEIIGGMDHKGQPCEHSLCQECATESREASGGEANVLHAQCPICYQYSEPPGVHQTKGTWRHMAGDDERALYFNKTGVSCKVDALMEDLAKVPSESKRWDSEVRSIVFSCWTRTLDLVGVHLRRRGFSYQRIDGDQVLTQRQYNMDRFVQDRCIPVLLMSTGVGAFGLNLTAASNVFMLEPQWNPSVEAQAVGRVSRLGQNKAVKVTRYLVRRTVEVVRSMMT